MSGGTELEAALTTGVLRRRCAAWVVDAMLIAGLAALAWQACLIFGILTLGLGLPLFSALPAIPILYTWLFVASSMGATPGMALFDLVVARDADYGPPGPIAALAWAAGFYVTVAVGAIWLGVALLTNRRRTLHDILAGLVIVRMKALTAAIGFGIIGPGGHTPA